MILRWPDLVGIGARALSALAAVAFVVLLALEACGPKVGPNGVSSDDAIVVVKSNVRDAQVYLDGRFVASLEVLGGGIAVSPGTHRLELRHDDFFSGYLELELVRAERRKVSLALAPVLP